MARAIWKGSISFGLVHIPVGLYPAEQRDELHLRMIDRRDMAPIGYERVNKRTDQKVPWDEIVKGYEYEDGRYVVLTAEDLKRANVEATRTVEIVDFVDAEEINPVYYERPYYLAPLTKRSKGYALLRETLRRTGKIGIAKVVIRTREHLAAVIAHGPVLLLDLMRYPHEVRQPEALDLPGDDLGDLGITEKEIRMAERLVEEMVEPWDPAKYHDTYRDDLRALVEKKVRSGGAREVDEPAAGGPEIDAEVIDLTSVLKKSLERKQKAKPSGGKVAASRKKTAGRKSA